MGLLSYIQPAKAKKAAAQKVEAEMVIVSNEKITPSVAASSEQGRSPWTSRPGSLYQGSEVSASTELRCDMLVNWLYQEQMRLLWTNGGHDEGIIIKKGRGQYACCPPDLETTQDGSFLNAIQTLNVRSAMTVNSRIIKLFLQTYPSTTYVPLRNGLRVQVIPSMSSLPQAQRHHFAAFIADRAILVVWDDNPKHLMTRAEDIQESLMAVVWPDEEDESEPIKEKDIFVNVNDASTDDSSSIEQQDQEQPRRIVLNQAILMAFTLMLVTVACGSGYAEIAKQIYLDGNYIRIAFVIALPAQVWLALFFFQAVCGNIAQIIGPISQVNQNTKTYSGLAPRRTLKGALPHVTVQIPVYKEGLTAVIEPTVHSIKAAISTYEMQGGTANIFVNDDGMQLLSEEEAHARQEFYDEHNIVSSSSRKWR